MNMSTYAIDHKDFVQELKMPVADKEYSFTTNNHRWGGYTENKTAFGPISIYEINAQLHQDFKILYRDDQMNNDIHVCATLRGNIFGKFCEKTIEDKLNESTHHYLFAPDANYELDFRDVHVLHVTVAREYYIDLLNDSEPWLSTLRKDLESKNIVNPGSRTLDLSMRKTVMDIIANPLTGNLRDLMLEGKAMELIALQLNQYLGTGIKKKISKKEEEIFYAIREHLAQSFNQNHTLQSLCREFGINEFKLKKGFRTIFGTTVFDFIHDKKMEKAHHLIKEENLYINEVSRQIGYKNPNHFSTAFKKKFGIRPNELRSN
jgi:AraC-like DNA-binding protein